MGMTAQDKMKREAQVKVLIEEGLSINEMAAKFGCSQQAMQRFLKLRGWRTKAAVKRDGGSTVPDEDPVKAERKARRAAMKEIVDRS